MKHTNLAPILIVEDEPDHSRLIKKSLVASGRVLNDLFLCENGQEALDYLHKVGKYKNLKRPLPTLILLDVKMPIKNGFQVLKRIKADDKLNKIPVVILTTTSTDEDIEHAMNLGANDYIVKPINFGVFTEKVSKLGLYWGLISDVKKIIK